VVCAAALGAITTIEELDLAAAAGRIGDVMLPRLRDMQSRFPTSAMCAGGARWWRSSWSAQGRRRRTRR